MNKELFLQENLPDKDDQFLGMIAEKLDMGEMSPEAARIVLKSMLRRLEAHANPQDIKVQEARLTALAILAEIHPSPQNIHTALSSEEQTATSSQNETTEK